MNKMPPRKELRQYANSGLSRKEIAEECGVTQRTVSNWLARCGISSSGEGAEENHDVNVGLATVVAIDTDDDGIITFAAPGGGVVVGAIAARCLAEAMHFEMGGV